MALFLVNVASGFQVFIVRSVISLNMFFSSLLLGSDLVGPRGSCSPIRRQERIDGAVSPFADPAIKPRAPRVGGDRAIPVFSFAWTDRRLGGWRSVQKTNG